MIGVLGNKTKDKKLTIGGEEVFGTAYDLRRIVIVSPLSTLCLVSSDLEDGQVRPNRACGPRDVLRYSAASPTGSNKGVRTRS